VSNPVQPSGTLTSITQFSFLFTALVTVIGWFIAAQQAERREFRKEVREHIKVTAERAGKVRDSAASYWLEPGANEGRFAIALKADVMALARQVQTLGLLGLAIDPDLMAAVRTHSTGGDFEKRERQASLEDELRLLDIAGAIEDLLIEVDSCFYANFPPKNDGVRHFGAFRRIVPVLGLAALSSDHR